MRKQILEDMSCDACGSWEFECRDDGENYCSSCSLPFVKKDDEPVNKRETVRKQILEDMGWDACGSWEFECRDDEE